MHRGPIASAALYAAVILVALLILMPLAWLLIMSVSSTADLTQLPLHWLPDEFDFSRYRTLLTVAPNTPGETFLYALRNSLIVALSATVISMLVAIPAAYSFSRLPGRRNALLYGVIATFMMPPVALVVPMYLILSQLGLLNNPLGLIVIYCTMLVPFTTWLLKSNFDNVPFEIERAAIVDGAGITRIILRVVLPLVLPALGTSALFAILLAWDEFFYALIYTSDLRAATLTVAIADIASGRATDYGLISAAGVLAALPPVLIAIFLQRALVSGLSSGGVKE